MLTSTVTGTIYYTLTGGKSQEETKYTKEIEIDKSGVTRLTVWIVGKDGKESRKVTEVIKVDIDKPGIENITLKGDKGENVEGASGYKWIISSRRNRDNTKSRYSNKQGRQTEVAYVDMNMK